jgi:fluoroquinolone transport system permease protein
MNTFTLFKTLGPVDLKNASRDPLLTWMPALPLFLALFLRAATPKIALLLESQWAFDLRPFYPLLMSNFVVMTSTVAGLVVGFLLLDERDDGTLLALQVTPLPPQSYLLYRLAAPTLVGLMMTLVGYPLAGLTPLPLVDQLMVAVLGALSGPQIALVLALFAANKVAGFALLKVLNAVMMLPVAAYFAPLPWQWLAGLLPPYWPLKVFWLAAAGENYWLYWTIGLVVNLAAVALLLHWFARRMVR